ncbi:MAG: PQQ-dependent sugar dehydrogenase [Ornithinimicrobium sp.]|uniref:PQQ-dependent sugar dehydrogenase n=1 Tax=Ornithinimicrobium sp. TaxID=1977084 RepID=UPI0026E03A58|nr:PQQ-dependent sugar dehydrogenase [Ornithinimicrobium sp.]MDO5739903.1 PQQ-dependent sugar dehydrogenase [Ornithinimicrobium sp.]
MRPGRDASLRRAVATLAVAVVGSSVLAGCTGPDAPEAEPTSMSSATSSGQAHTGDGAGSTEGAAALAPRLDVEVVMEGLDIPWDVQFLPDGTALVTERTGRLLARSPDGQVRQISTDLSVLASGEAGLLGIAVSPDFAQDRMIFLCHASDSAAVPEVRVTRLALDAGATKATTGRVVVDSLPFTSGRHSGCRLLFTPDGTLLVGTGDAADESNPQDLSSLGGKVLALTPDGDPAEAAGSVEGADARILTYGHRNVQGLAVQPTTGLVWEVEHGPDVDDEVNVLVPGSNYGWDPGPGYEEGVPMTDLQAFPDAVEAIWSSGDPTHATSGATFLQGEQWGAWAGALAVAELKGSGVTVLRVEGQQVSEAVRVPELDGTYGRLRSLTLAPDGALWVTSSNGGDDVVLRVVPQAR